MNGGYDLVGVVGQPKPSEWREKCIQNVVEKNVCVELVN